MGIPKLNSTRNPEADLDVRDLVASVIPNPSVWLDTPHDLLGGKKPNDLLGTTSENRVRELALAIKFGIPT